MRAVNIANGALRIGFIQPNLDLVIVSDSEDLKAFVYTVDVVKDIVLPPKCSDSTHMGIWKCICQGQRFSQYRRYHSRAANDCPLSIGNWARSNLWNGSLCARCCYQVLKCYNDADAQKIVKSWNKFIMVSAYALFPYEMLLDKT